MTQPEPLPYLVCSDVSFNEFAAQNCRVRLVPDERDPEAIIIEGPCARCRHETLFHEPTVAYRDLSFAPIRDRLLRRSLLAAAAEVRVRDVEVICDCRQVHPEPPPGKQGCGASWTLRVEWGAD